ncbi:hypothetical protein [Pseudomonas sp. Hg5Tf]|uniref:PA2794-like C-terminal domain-containing protein n=1 Tax=Pseudomonas sp. Hg7Tf TaxID=3236988 RepID=A0AB39HQH2_9PSED|nr:hypothetical protein [Pseudomonas sp. Hg5Tf]MDH2558993.1 hypothetical protein [Pseudomonas sp. Hg5Tf]
MTVSTTDSVEEYVSGGPSFPISYRFLQNSDIEAVLVKQDGTSETLVLGTQYTLTGAGAQNGGTLTSSYASGVLATPGATLTISRVMDAVQPTDLRNQGRYFAETHENVFDRLTMLIQQGLAWTRRALVRPVGKDYYDAEGRRIANVGDPTANGDAVNKLSMEQYVASVIESGTGPINQASNVIYIDPDGIPRTVQDLASPEGSNYIGDGVNPGTVSDSLRALEARADAYDSVTGSGAIKYLANEGRVNRLARSRDFAVSVVGKVLQSGRYDHFGQMDMLPDGTLCLFYRSGTTHDTDNAPLRFTTQLANGNWATPTNIVQDPIYDLRDPAGGVMSNGRIAIATTTHDMATPSLFPELRIYTSDNYGGSWVLRQSIAVPAGQMKFPHGKGFHSGDKYCIPYYATPAGGGRQLRLLETTDGGLTWVEGATVYSGAVNYNETGYVNLGGGLFIGASRVDGAGGGKIRLWRSVDGAVTWTDIGDMDGIAGDGTSILVSPSLTSVVTSSGTVHAVLFYTDRTTTQLVYRTIARNNLLPGGTPKWSARTGIYSAPNLSGYQSHVVIGSRILGSFFREITFNVLAEIAQWEVFHGDLPDYQSDWTAVVPSTQYTFTHGLQRAPRKVVVEFATTNASPGQTYVVQASYFNDGANKGSGAQVAINGTQILVGTGAAVWGTAYFGGIDTSTRYTSGYYRVSTWL